jgi:hypothetical protein
MADFYKVVPTDAEVAATGLIVHVVPEGTELTKVRYTSVRMGLSFPSKEAKGAYVVLGQEWLDSRLYTGTGRLLLLDEYQYQDLSLDRFFEKLTDSFTLLMCDTLYAEEIEPYHTALSDFCDKHRLNVDLISPPYADDFFAGLSIANDWFKKNRLELDQSSMTRAELKSITKEDLDNSPEARFPLVNSLRHLVSGFRKYPPVQYKVPKRSRGHRQPHAWMEG